MACGLTLVLIAHVQGLRPPVIETHEVVLNGLPADLDETTVAVMADCHVGETMVGSRWLSARIDQVQTLQLIASSLSETCSSAAVIPRNWCRSCGDCQPLWVCGRFAEIMTLCALIAEMLLAKFSLAPAFGWLITNG